MELAQDELVPLYPHHLDIVNHYGRQARATIDSILQDLILSNDNLSSTREKSQCFVCEDDNDEMNNNASSLQFDESKLLQWMAYYKYVDFIALI